MEFAITLKGDISPRRTVALCRQAELAGFSHAWFYDSHILWRDPWVTMAMCMEHTETMRFGPCVTNPGVRDWSVAASMYAALAMQGGGRLELGVGRGDSSMRVMGKTPKTIARMSEFVHAVKGMVRGDAVRYAEAPEAVQLTWAEGYELPVWIAAYGPRALRAAGEHGDGLVIQLAEPLLCRWFLGQALEAGEAAGRDMSDYRVMSAAPVWVGDVAKGREQTRWFPAMVGNHVADIVEKYGSATTEVPESFTRYIEGRRGYDYQEHASKDAGHLGFITDEVIDSFGILGPAEMHVEKLKALREAGVTQFNIYLMCGEEERIVAEYGEHVIPQFR